MVFPSLRWLLGNRRKCQKYWPPKGSYSMARACKKQAFVSSQCHLILRKRFDGKYIINLCKFNVFYTASHSLIIHLICLGFHLCLHSSLFHTLGHHAGDCLATSVTSATWRVSFENVCRSLSVFKPSSEPVTRPNITKTKPQLKKTYTAAQVKSQAWRFLMSKTNATMPQLMTTSYQLDRNVYKV